jgi:hypothetical protein
MSRFRNPAYGPSDRLCPTRDRSYRRSPRYAIEWLEDRLSPSTLTGLPGTTVLVQSYKNDVPVPDDPYDPPPSIPPYEPPIPPGGPATPK